MTESTRALTTPLYAAVGAGDYVVAQFNDVVTQLRERTEAATESAQTRLDETKARLVSLPDEVPSNIEDLRAKLRSEELRKTYEGYVDSATGFYNSLADRGEETVGRLRTQPLVQENLDRAGKLTGFIGVKTDSSAGETAAAAKKPAAKKTTAKKAPAKKSAAKKAPAKKAAN